LIQKVLFFNRWRQNIEGEAANPGSPEKRLLKWRKVGRYIHRESKKGATLTMAITSSILD